MAKIKTIIHLALYNTALITGHAEPLLGRVLVQLLLEVDSGPVARRRSAAWAGQHYEGDGGHVGFVWFATRPHFPVGVHRTCGEPDGSKQATRHPVSV